jgi:hypothetical protein
MTALRPPPAAPPDEDDPPEPPRLRALRRLVTLLTATAILGVVVVAAALVIRLSQPLTSARPDLRQVSAQAIGLPTGETALAATLSGGALTVLTVDAAGDRRIRLFDPADGAPGPVIAVTTKP